LKFHPIDQRTPEWKMLRLGIPTASDFHRIFTPVEQNKSKSYDDYLNKKIAERLSGEEDPDDMYQNRYMQMGVESETQSIAGYKFLTEIETEPGGFFTTDDGMAGASPDRLAGKNGLVEFKAHKLSMQVKAARNGVQLDHAPQLQGQLWICEREWIDLYNLNEILPLPYKRITRNEKYIKKIKDSVEAFNQEMLRVIEDFKREYGVQPKL
jgi:hypothetical protein